MRTPGDVALVSGAGGTLGHAVVTALAERGDQVVALTRGEEVPGLADELAARRVRANVVLPALIAAGSGAARSSPAVPAAEIAAVIALCSDAAGAVTGATVRVYGWA